MSQDTTLGRKGVVVSVDEKFDDGEHKQVTADDVSDENPVFLAGLIRALQREMRAGFEMLREEMRTDRKQRDITEDRVTDHGERLTDIEQRLAAREQLQQRKRK